jgi:hypothetical protein
MLAVALWDLFFVLFRSEDILFTLSAALLLLLGSVNIWQGVIGLALIIVDVKAAARGRFWGVSVTAPQVRPILITVWIVVGLVVIALWLWMAQANGQGRNWARILSTVLFGLATLQLFSDLQQAVRPAGTVEPVLGLLLAVLGWLPGLAAVWLLWRPVSSTFFKPRGFTQALPRQV